MKRIKNILLYAGVLCSFLFIMYLLILAGKTLEVGRNVKVNQVQISYFTQFFQSLSANLGHPLALILAQIIVIIIVSRIFSIIFKWINQPTVIGEIIAGIVLGPSFLGIVFPEFSMALFPVKSLENLSLLSQIGLILFMFIVGMELDAKALQSRIKDAIVVSNAGILIPFILGLGLAYFIYQHFAPQGVPFLSFGLFLGMAMSITAFPVLARIVQERGIHRTRLGAMVITCAAVDDISAWCMLAAIIAIVKAGSVLSSVYTILLSIAYVLVMLKVVRPFLKRVGDLHASRENLSKPVVAIFFLVLMISSYTTEIIGIHALFGAFLLGTIMPANTKFRNIFIEKIEDISLVLLLPLFFVFTGLRTQIGLLNDLYLWKITGLIILVAIAGKFAGSALTSRIMGQSWRDSLTIGALMNTRGLMELVVLNIGYDLGILSPQIFSMMVIMALTTTFMTGPSLDLINRIFKQKTSVVAEKINQLRKFKIILSFGNPEMGASLLRLAYSLVKKQKENTSITALHLCPSNVLHHYNLDDYEQESFSTIISESKAINQKITTLFKASDNIEGDIVEIANQGDFDLLLVGIGQSIFEGSFLGRILGYTTRFINPDRIMQKVSGKEKLFTNSPFDERTQTVLSGTKISMGIFVDKNAGGFDRIIFPFFNEKDAILLEYVQRFIKNSEAQVTITDQYGIINKHSEIKETIRAIEQEAPNHIALNDESTLNEQSLKEYQLMLISSEGWKNFVDSKNNWIKRMPSILIMRA
jgi:Kef-type K+ transport system membrane component KefB